MISAFSFHAFADEFSKIAGVPPPLPAAARQGAKKLTTMGAALFEGAAKSKTNPFASPGLLPKTPLLPTQK